MSLLSPESLSIFVSPTELVALRWRGIRPQIAEKRLCPVSAKPGKLWEGAVQAFGELLREFSACRRVRVILSSHLTQYQLQPWREDLNDRDEELAVAQLAFTQTYGEAAGLWQVRISDDAPGRAKVAAAVDADLLAALEKAAGASKARLTTIQPYFTAAVNHWRKRFTRENSAWIILHEDERIAMALIERGQWRWVHSVRVGADWAERLPDLLDNEMMLAGIDHASTQVLVFSPAVPELAARVGSAWSFRSLRLEARQNFSPASDGRFGLALVG